MNHYIAGRFVLVFRTYKTNYAEHFRWGGAYPPFTDIDL